MNRLSSHLSQRRFFLNWELAVSSVPFDWLVSVDPLVAWPSSDGLRFSFLNSSSITNTLVRYLSSGSQPVSKTISVSSLYALANVDLRLAAARFSRLWSTLSCSAATSSELRFVTLPRLTSTGNGRCSSSDRGWFTRLSMYLSL
ncbi:hypothetical protein OGAPHI_001184 [Ogataea philodendri]|uniref:Uncharacterized protein n=1 Tax=Ogataea philodendri TaxID=1378263 RepID=A0A9P8T9J7_9ASCO|nr:uncharacterized protein OGAPHI_001184 [Ogataea philodendri]KAH3670669.1 hypothetical protein OGAPHI_001184 [Ogataea philodendri]